MRKLTRKIFIGNVAIGGDSPISVQSMTNTKTHDTESTVNQIRQLTDAGVDIVRLAVPDMTAAKNLHNIIERVQVPLVADIHFDYQLALEAINQGISALRINPGNIGSKNHVQRVVEQAQMKKIPIRIGVNAGSLDKKFKSITPEALVESALEHVKILEDMDFHDIKISLKSHDVPTTISAYRLMSATVDYPLHVGITEAGTEKSGLIKSSVGIGALLAEGIGDTIRVSLTGDPVREVVAGNEILKCLGLKNVGATLISCPTCGRTRIDLPKIANIVEEKISNIKTPIQVAVMGCVVNGPGEAREADVGIAGADGEGILFKKGQVIKKLPESELIPALLAEIDKIIAENR